jgi:uncharacterized RDD family membrane protein YckC
MSAMHTPPEVVTGEAVVVEVRVAQLPSRAVAIVLDLIVQTLVLVGVLTLLGMVAVITDPALFAATSILLWVLVAVGYPVLFETLTRGRSLGKLALGLRVVSDDGGPERFRQALFRGLAGFVELWALSGAPALISSLISEKGKRLGDVFAGTIVISERAPREEPPPPMPPELAGWAATLELSRLPEHVAGTARQYLSRWPQLSPAVRAEMGGRIAAEVASCVFPPPPPGVPPAAYLAAVLAERRRREQLRLARQAGHQEPPPGLPGLPPHGPPAPLALAAPPRPVHDAAPREPYGTPPSPAPAPPPPPAPAEQVRDAAPQATPGGFVPPA